MKVSRSLSDLPKPPRPYKPTVNQTIPEEESPYRLRMDAYHRKPPSREWKSTLSGAVPFSADQVSGSAGKDIELPALAGYLPPYREKQWTTDQLKFIDK